MDYEEALDQKIEDFHTLGCVWVGPELHDCIGLDCIHEMAVDHPDYIEWYKALKDARTFEQCQEYHKVFPELFDRIVNEIIEQQCDKALEWEGENRD